MQLQFQPTAHSCMQRVVWEIKNEEQTQEVRLPDTMPDAAQILACWGQPVIRSKEWRGNSMSVSGGVMAWVLYEPENAQQPESIETWIPFQLRWDFPQTQRDGQMVFSCLLQSIDARQISARKLMLRTVISASGEALEPGKIEVYAPMELPEDVKILRSDYPVNVAAEAGEKTFVLDEALNWPASCADVEKIIYYTLQPELIDQKVMADKAVFRGAALIHALCQTVDGQLCTCKFEVPFSQFAELEREYDPYAAVQIVPALTSLELEKQEDGTVRLKAGLIGQYVVYDRKLLQIVEDAYSLQRPVQLQTQPLTVLSVLEDMTQTVKAEQSLETDAASVVDVSFNLSQPTQHRSDDAVTMELLGTFQLLCADEEGKLQGTHIQWQGQVQTAADPNTQIVATGQPSASAQAVVNGGSVSGSTDVLVRMQSAAELTVPMVSALDLGEMTAPDPARPSLILRRPGSQSLWDLAKEAGSTVEAIMEANALDATPEDDRLLLIPVI